MMDYLERAKDLAALANGLFLNSNPREFQDAIIEAAVVSGMFSVLSIADDMRQMRLLYQQMSEDCREQENYQAVVGAERQRS